MRVDAERLEDLVELVERERPAAQHPALRPGARRRSSTASPPGAGPPSTIDRDLVAEHLLGLVGVGGRRAAGQVGRAHRERTGALEQLERDLVVGHPDRDRAAGVAQVPLQRGLLAADQGQRAGPERVDQRAGAVGDADASASRVVAALTSTGGGMSRPRPLASSSAWTASGSKASAPMP